MAIVIGLGLMLTVHGIEMNKVVYTIYLEETIVIHCPREVGDTGVWVLSGTVAIVNGEWECFCDETAGQCATIVHDENNGLRQ